MSWFAGFEPIVRSEAPLAEYTWYRLGGPARWLVQPRDEVELATLLNRCADAGISWRVLGRGANVLVSDEGVDGAVFKLSGPGFDQVSYSRDVVTAGAAADFPRFIRDTLDRGVIGLEVLAGIPGTVGGVVRMNAGGRYGEIRQFVKDVKVLDTQCGEVMTRTPKEMGFSYRHTELGGAIVLGARLQLQSGDRNAALARHKEIWNEKYEKQPPLSVRSAGCIFKNPPGESAGRLLDAAGLKGARVGGAEISPKHANFIVAHPSATARDVLDLARLAADRVWNATGVKLEMEVEVW
jgi:UDP-N-acetylmuramate dehydrogenase